MTIPPPPLPLKPPSPWGDRLFRWLCQFAGLIVLLIAAALVAMLVWRGWEALSHVGQYEMVTGKTWSPDRVVEGQRSPAYGIWVFVYGTLVTSAIGMLIAVPLGVGAAAYLSEIAPGWVRRTCSFLIELLAAIPSVVYGFWGIVFLTPILNQVFLSCGIESKSSGKGLLAAGMILALMILPYIVAISFDVCRAVPASQRQGALALGATRWQMIWHVVLPHARSGIIAACFLALGRALGETMAVTMLIGNEREIHWSLFAAGDSIASVLANQMNDASYEDHRSALVVLALVLLGITALTNLLARWLIFRTAKPKVRAGKAGLKLTHGTQEFGPLIVAPSAWRRTQWHNRLMTFVLASCQFLTVVPLFLILGYIGYRGIAALDLNFFTKLPVPPGQTGGGLSHALQGSALLVLCASAIAVPLGILVAVYLHEYNTHRLTKPVRFITEILSGVPSIVIGIFAYAVLIRPPWTDEPWKLFGWAGVLALAVMMLPVIVRTSEEAMKLVPSALRQASYALGASQWQTVVRVILPASLPAIITGVLLAMARIAGETAPLVLTAMGSRFRPHSLDDQTPFLPGYIYDYSKSGDAEQIRQAWAAAVVLLAAVLVMNIGIRVAAGRRVIAASRAD